MHKYSARRSERQKATLVYNNSRQREDDIILAVTVAFLSASAAGLTAASFSTRCAASANTCGERDRDRERLCCDERGECAVKCTFPPCHSRSGRRKGCESISRERVGAVRYIASNQQFGRPNKERGEFLIASRQNQQMWAIWRIERGKYERSNQISSLCGTPRAVCVPNFKYVEQHLSNKNK